MQKKEREEALARPSAGNTFVPPSKRAAGYAPPAARGRDEVSLSATRPTTHVHTYPSIVADLDSGIKLSIALV